MGIEGQEGWVPVPSVSRESRGEGKGSLVCRKRHGECVSRCVLMDESHGRGVN